MRKFSYAKAAKRAKRRSRERRAKKESARRAAARIEHAPPPAGMGSAGAEGAADQVAQGGGPDGPGDKRDAPMIGSEWQEEPAVAKAEKMLLELETEARDG